ncbi:MAG: ECF transporter S component [Oscillospiraceae bacterium]|jgi:uncharacterized membrane protein|nr:ECF transporter S component [Oscillospiraceae bacterium]
MAKNSTNLSTKAQSTALVHIVLTALLAALVFVVTYLLSIPVPGTQGGYVNLGDAVIFLTALLVGNPWALLAAGLGSGLADLLAGATIYILPTVIIKGLMGFVVAAFAKNDNKWLFRLGTVIGGIIMIGGYFVYELYFIKSGEITGLPYALNALPGNFGQAGVCIAVSWIFHKPILSLKTRLLPQSKPSD